MKLGVFDSGIGGKALAAELEKAFPDARIHVVDDHEHVPYGSKTQAEIIRLTDAAIQPLLQAACDVIILACNSASTAALEELRHRYPLQAFIGLEPMVKPAARLTESGSIAVCATPATLSSARYRWLCSTYASSVHILEPDCSNWAFMIEQNRIDAATIERIVDDCCIAGADVIVLGCTHYHWIKDLVIAAANGRAQVLEPTEAVIRRIRSLLASPESVPKVL